MKREERKLKIKETAMKMVATKGLDAVSMKEIAKTLDVRESTLYRDFETLEALITETFLDVCRDVVAFTENITVVPLGYEMPKKTMVEYSWFNFLRFLVDCDYKTIFYIRVRNAYAYEFLRSQEMEILWEGTFFQKFRAHVLEVLHIHDEGNQEVVWSYIYFFTLHFAERIIFGYIPDAPETYERMRLLLFKGIEAFGES